MTEPVDGTEPLQFKQVGWRTLYLFGRSELTGDYITDASIGQDQQNFGQYYVQLSFSPAGADRFEEVTGANVNRRFAIILDDIVDSAPVIKQKIGGGRATITMGAGDPEKQLHDAKQLELVLRSGALPAPITPSSESTIGPSLGRDSIAEAAKGGLLGSIAVLLFMFLYYRKSGVVADIAVHLQPHAAARGPRDLQRDDDAPGHRGPRAHARHERRRERPHQRAYPRGAAHGQERPSVRSMRDTRAPGRRSSTGT